MGDPGWNEGDGTVFVDTDLLTDGFSFQIDSILPLGEFGWSIAPTGDVDGDGFDDVVVGGPRVSNPDPVEGNVYSFRGGSDLSLPSRTIDNPTDVDQSFGQSVAGGRDLNGDGFTDMLTGRLPRLFVGATTGFARTPELNLPSPGGTGAVATPGDFNGDGYADYVIEGPGRDEVTVFLGAASLTNIPHKVLEGPAGSNFGLAIAR